MKKKEEMENEQAISGSEMWDLLINLYGTPTWSAIIKYNNSKDASALQALATLDPISQATLMARSQGIRTGLRSLEKDVAQKVQDVIADKKVREKELEDKKNGITRSQGY